MPVTEKQIVTTLLRDRMAILARIDAIVSDAHRAEDVLQDLSLAALDKRNSIEDATHLRRWLRKVARDLAIDHLRHEGRSPAVLGADVLDQFESHWAEYDNLETAEVQRAIRRCMDQLTPYNRRLIEQRYQHNLTGEALAASLGRSINTIKVALTRAHRTMLTCLRRRMSAGAAEHS